MADPSGEKAKSTIACDQQPNQRCFLSQVDDDSPDRTP